jgi:hypothetical protein
MFPDVVCQFFHRTVAPLAGFQFLAYLTADIPVKRNKFFVYALQSTAARGFYFSNDCRKICFYGLRQFAFHIIPFSLIFRRVIKVIQTTLCARQMNPDQG